MSDTGSATAPQVALANKGERKRRRDADASLPDAAAAPTPMEATATAATPPSSFAFANEGGDENDPQNASPTALGDGHPASRKTLFSPVKFARNRRMFSPNAKGAAGAGADSDGDAVTPPHGARRGAHSAPHPADFLSPRKVARQLKHAQNPSAQRTSDAILQEYLTTEDEAARQDLKKQLMARAEALNNQRTLTSNHRDAIRAMLIHTNNNTAVVNEVRLQQWELSFGNWLFRSALFSPIVFALTECFVAERVHENETVVEVGYTMRECTSMVHLFAPPAEAGADKLHLGTVATDFVFRDRFGTKVYEYSCKCLLVDGSRTELTVAHCEDGISFVSRDDLGRLLTLQFGEDAIDFASYGVLFVRAVAGAICLDDALEAWGLDRVADADLGTDAAGQLDLRLHRLLSEWEAELHAADDGAVVPRSGA